MNAKPDHGTFRETVIMSSQRKYRLMAAPLLVAVIVTTGCSGAKRTHKSGEPLTHTEIAGSRAVDANIVESRGTETTPHLECEITPGRNVLWCAAFQVAWNELCNSLGGPIRWSNAPEMVDILNKRTVVRSDLDENSIVAVAGKTTGGPDDIRQKITQELDRKFTGTANPELLSLLNGMSSDLWVTYAYLYKELPFNWAFNRTTTALSFAGHETESFGMADFDAADRNQMKMASQVLVYDYRGDDDFIVELKTRSASDRLILAKIPPGRTLAETIIAADSRLQQSSPSSMQAGTPLVVPLIDFDLLRTYKELLGENSPIGLSAQQIRFKLDEKGAVLKSEAMLVAAWINQSLVFNRPFLIMVQRDNASQPYFALWVANADLLVPFHETSSKTSASVR
jgi:hypothetical protein